jgi:flavin-dependent dehydrogenase
LILDGRRIASHQRLDGDVVVLGAGAAGITLARSLARRGHDVLLLESGGFQYDPPTQDL